MSERQIGLALVVFAVFTAVSPAAATPLLLTPSAESTLEGWLGQGNLDFTNIYEKAPGDTSVDFHAAVDGKGATFTLFEAMDTLGSRHILGGYNPQPWNSVTGYNITILDSQRTGFIYRLTTNGAPVNQIRRQKLSTDPIALGQYQTFNLANYGPTFGWGHDLYVSDTLSDGFEWPNAYGPGWHGSGDTGLIPASITDLFTVQRLEVYTFEPAAVPEPASLAFVVSGLAVLGGGVAFRRRRSW